MCTPRIEQLGDIPGEVLLLENASNWNFRRPPQIVMVRKISYMFGVLRLSPTFADQQ